ncbi:MAG: hypothetical protein JWQ25_2015, partial [Daejeonella sp.]|nr:hypothetical protein [Daejeonella sp.]
MRKLLLITFILFTSIAHAASVYTDFTESNHLVKHLFLASEEVITYDGVPFICPDGNKVLTASGAPTGATFQWYKNSILIANAQSATCTVTETGEYSVIVTDAGISKTYPKIKIEVVPLPIAKFTQPPNGDCSAIRQLFTNESTGQSLIYEWNFGDPNSGANNITRDADGRH